MCDRLNSLLHLTATPRRLALAVCILGLALLLASREAAGARVSAAGAGSHGSPGALTIRPIRLVPPMALADALTRHIHAGPHVWVLSGDADSDALADRLADLNLTDHDFHTVLAHLERRDDGAFLLELPVEATLDLSAPGRASLYDWLALNDANTQQVNAARFWGTLDQWLPAGGALPPAVRSAARRLCYRRGSMACLADLSLVLKPVRDQTARARIVQQLFAQRGVDMTLHVAPGQNVEPLITYWGAGTGHAALRRRLTALALHGGGDVPVRELLPPFARQRLDTFGHDTSALDPERDCHWTALNFWSTTPDDRFTEMSRVLRAIRSDYRPVDRPRFGDLVMFCDGGTLFHSAVYIADGMLFTKNGPRAIRPWMLMPITAVRDFYPTRHRIQVRFARRRSVAPGPRLQPLSHSPILEASR